MIGTVRACLAFSVSVVCNNSLSVLCCDGNAQRITSLNPGIRVMFKEMLVQNSSTCFETKFTGLLTSPRCVLLPVFKYLSVTSANENKSYLLAKNTTIFTLCLFKESPDVTHGVAVFVPSQSIGRRMASMHSAVTADSWAARCSRDGRGSCHTKVPFR